MNLPASLLQAAVAGLALAATAACEKDDLPAERHADECRDGCVDPAVHAPDDPVYGDYSCPACGMG